MPSPFRRSWLAQAAVLACSIMASAAAPIIWAETTPATVSVSQTAHTLHWQSSLSDAEALLRLSHPDGRVSEQKFPTGVVELELDPLTLAAGVYRVEIRFYPRHAIKAERGGNTPAPAQAVYHGSFRIEQGQLYSSANGVSEAPSGASKQGVHRIKDPNPASPNDNVIADDQIVQGSLCVGLDCVNNESFGFDTLRLKENNTRIKFEDTSTSAGFPTHDWQLTANDSASGGAEKFSIEDITAATVPLTITGSAPTHSLFVGSNGKIGLRTSTPVLDLHFLTTDTPAIRLEQSNGGGFTAQTWDVAGNEANFFVRDVTGGSRLPLRIRPGAPTSSLDISASGNVGVGTASPSAALHLRRLDGSAQLLVDESSGSTASRILLEARNNGAVGLHLEDSSLSQGWNMTGSSNLVFSSTGGGIGTMTLASNGNLTINGTLSQGSSLTLKENLEPIQGLNLLQSLAKLPLYTWNYRQADKNDRHLGPTAEDFHRLFGLGNNEKVIAPGDMAGIALSAVQAMQQQLQAKEQALQLLQQRLEALEARLGLLTSSSKTGPSSSITPPSATPRSSPTHAPTGQTAGPASRPLSAH